MLGETRVNRFQESHGDQRLTYKVTEESSRAGGRASSSPDPLGFIYLVTKRNDGLWGREWVASWSQSCSLFFMSSRVENEFEGSFELQRIFLTAVW